MVSRWVLMCVLLFMVVSCGSGASAPSSSVDNDRIFQQYNVWYDANKNEMTTYAQFRFAGNDGTTLRLSEPSYVYVNDNPMNVVSGLHVLPALNGVFYKKRFDVAPAHPNVVRFRYQNNERVQVSNEISIPEDQPNVSKLVRIENRDNKPADLKLSIDNVNMENLREVICHLVKRDGSLAVSRMMDRNTRECRFNLSELESFSAGTYQTELRSTWQFDSVQRVGNAGGRRYLTIVSAKKEIVL